MVYKRLTPKLRKLMRSQLRRECDKCWYCGINLEDRIIHIDHIVPLSKGGRDDIDNYALTCDACNHAKLDMELIQHLKWLSHIRSGNFECYIIKKLKKGLEGTVNDKLQKSYYN